MTQAAADNLPVDGPGEAATADNIAVDGPREDIAADNRPIDGAGEDATADNSPVDGPGKDVPIDNSPKNGTGEAAAANNRSVDGPGEDAIAGSATDYSAEVAKALSSMLSSVIRDFDLRAESCVRSQDHLSLSIDRLTGELDQLLEDAPLPFVMQHAARISGVRKRVSSLNVLLKSIQRRLDNVDRLLLTAPLQHEKSSSESTRPNQPET